MFYPRVCIGTLITGPPVLLLQLAESLGSVVVLICMGSGIAFGAFRTGWAIRGLIRRYWPKKIGGTNIAY